MDATVDVVIKVPDVDDVVVMETNDVVMVGPAVVIDVTSVIYLCIVV